MREKEDSTCLWCQSSVEFDLEEGKIDSKWGKTAHKVKLYICRNCGYTHLFSLGRTMWDMDYVSESLV